MTADDVISTLGYLFQVHGEPEFIRSDNGPEFVATAVQEWLAASGIGTLYISPGSPWENAYAETFNGKLEDELLGREIFFTLAESKVLIEQYRLEYNHERPHSSLGYQTPAEFAAKDGFSKKSQPEPSFPRCCGELHLKVLSSQRVETSLIADSPNGWYRKRSLVIFEQCRRVEPTVGEALCKPCLAGISTRRVPTSPRHRGVKVSRPAASAWCHFSRA